MKPKTDKVLKKIEKLKSQADTGQRLSNDPETAETEQKLLDAAARVKKEGINDG